MNSVPPDMFVDASAWLVYLDTDRALHAYIANKIDKHIADLVTSDYELNELSRSALPKDNDRVVKLIWKLWGRGCVVKVSEDEKLLAWHVFLNHKGTKPSFTMCTSLSLIRKYHINNLVTCNGWLKRAKSRLLSELEAIHQLSI